MPQTIASQDRMRRKEFSCDRTPGVAPSPSTHHISLAGTLLESDCRYFEFGAKVRSLDHAKLVHMPGLEELAAGCVVQRIAMLELPDDLDAWIGDVERRVRELGARRPRLYLQTRFLALELALERRGYRRREEFGWLSTTVPAAARSSVLLRPLESEADWRAKVSLHAACGVGPDGHVATPEKWVELERRKAEHGELKPYLIEQANEICGALALINCGELLRLKNLAVHPAHRGRGVGRQAIRQVFETARRHGKSAVGCFAIARGAGAVLYEHCGFEIVNFQTEWT